MAETRLEITYSQQASNYIEGRAYSNPRFYSTPRQGVSKVYIVGDWPKIVADYTALGVPVERIDAFDASFRKDADAVTARRVAALAPVVEPEVRAEVDIPEDWRELSWTKPNDAGLTLRGLAAQFADAPVINKAAATVAIEAELSRRASAEG